MSSSNSKKVVEFRQRRKKLAIEAFGGRCGICGYDKCPQALEFHHLDPNEKDFSMSVSGTTRSWQKTVPELRKCICVCSNCHREAHAGVTGVPENVVRFNEEYATRKPEPKPTHPCKKCGKDTSTTNTFCSIRCAQLDSTKIEWPSDQNILRLVQQQGFRSAGRVLGVSDNAVRKRLKRQGLL
jgi:endogenous inhibitor of DNA gyrase (YacG/DUF329 family)